MAGVARSVRRSGSETVTGQVGHNLNDPERLRRYNKWKKAVYRCRTGRGGDSTERGRRRKGQNRVVLYVLGGVRVEIDGQPRVLRGQVRRLLGILLAEPDQSVDTEVLIDRLWPEDTAPPTARKIVHILAGRLRPRARWRGRSRRRGSTAVDDRERLPASQWCDGSRSIRGAAPECRVDDRDRSASRARTALEEALDLWGRPWGAQGDEPWLTPRVAEIEERHRGAEELWADLVLETGRAGSSVDRIRAAALREPFPRAALGAAHVGDVSGRTSGRRVARLRRSPCVAQGRARCVSGARAAAVATRSSWNRTSRCSGAAFRPQMCSEQHPSSGGDGSSIRSRLICRPHRLVTVVGIGGIGKTRVVDEYAHSQRFVGDDVRHANFASVPVGACTAVHLAAELGLGADAQSDHEAVDLIAAFLGHEPVLLVLDGLEHAVDANAVVLRLIERCPRLKVLATSRVPLGVQAERTVNLQPLPIGTLGESDTGTAGTASNFSLIVPGWAEQRSPTRHSPSSSPAPRPPAGFRCSSSSPRRPSCKLTVPVHLPRFSGIIGARPVTRSGTRSPRWTSVRANSRPTPRSCRTASAQGRRRGCVVSRLRSATARFGSWSG